MRMRETPRNAQPQQRRPWLVPKAFFSGQDLAPHLGDEVVPDAQIVVLLPLAGALARLCRGMCRGGTGRRGGGEGGGGGGPGVTLEGTFRGPCHIAVDLVVGCVPHVGLGSSPVGGGHVRGGRDGRAGMGSGEAGRRWCGRAGR